MGSANDSEMGIDHDPSSEIKSNVTVNEKEQVERLFDSSSDEDGGDNSNSSSGRVLLTKRILAMSVMLQKTYRPLSLV